MPAEEEKKPDRRVGSAGYRIPEERKAAARILYETIPGLSQDNVAEHVGVSCRSIEEWSRKEGWKKAPILPPTGVSEAAKAVAESYVENISEYGKDLSTEQKGEAMQKALTQTAVETAVTVRAQLIDRHRREWSAPRNLIYEAMKTRNFDLCKIAKISAEALQIIQQNERKAWGFDPADNDKPSVVVIERD